MFLDTGLSFDKILPSHVKLEQLFETWMKGDPKKLTKSEISKGIGERNIKGSVRITRTTGAGETDSKEVNAEQLANIMHEVVQAAMAARTKGEYFMFDVDKV